MYTNSFVVFSICSLLFFNALLIHCQVPDDCPPCNCNEPVECSEEEALNPCNCCRRCTRGVGESCGETEGECSGNLLCLPNDPYSGLYNGTCYELSDCLSFGCSDEGDECNCFYSTECATTLFKYYTIDECKDALSKKNCESIVCPPQLNEQDCGTGMYFEQGPSYYDDCCPLGGRCVCNISMCTGEPECADNFKAVLVMPSDEDSGKCCDMYKCQEDLVCLHDGVKYNYSEVWQENVCKTCQCTLDGVLCTYTNCTQLEDCAITYVPVGQCCPLCFQSTDIFDNTQEIPIISGCITESGMTYDEGEVFMPGDCRTCRCEEGSVQCREKICEPLICDENEGYSVPEGECCPVCVDKILIPTIKVEKETTSPTEVSIQTSSITPTQPIQPTQPATQPSQPTQSTQLTQSARDTQSPSDIVVTTNPPSIQETQPTIIPSNKGMELVMVLNAPYKEVFDKWNEFSLELVTMLKSRNVHVNSLNISQSMDATVLKIMLEETDDISESQLAIMVSEVAQEYVYVESTQETSSLSPVGIEAEYTATIIVLTMLAAISLVSFIGVFIAVVLITRRLKMVKAIRGGQRGKRPIRRP